MPKLLVFQHVAYEILGTLDPLLRSYGFRMRYVNFGREPNAQPRINGYHGLVVLGGPMCVDQVAENPHLETEIRVIREAMDRGIPVLGICLGAQLLAKALGARVYSNHEKEIGWYDLETTEHGRSDPLFARFNGREKIFQWHGDTFELPRGAVHLAKSPTCHNQAFRYGERAYGFQFHMEVDEPLVERWLDVPLHQRELEALRGKICPDRIRRETGDYVARLKQLSDHTFAAFAELFGPLRRKPPGPHR